MSKSGKLRAQPLRQWLSRVAVAAVALLFPPQLTAAASPDVIVTLKPIHGLVAAVMEGVGTPHLLIDGAASPHTYAMRPSEVRQLNAAAVVVRVSDRLEVFLRKPLSLVGPRTRIVTLDRAAGLVLHAMRSGGDFEPHAHAHAHAHDHGRNAATRKRHHDRDHAAGNDQSDSHLWLDPRNARVIALHLGEELATAMPADAIRLRANARAVAEKAGELDQRLAGLLAPVADKPFLVFHDAYQYLERRYGLAGAGSVTINPDVPASARRLSDLRARLGKAGIVCVFAEPQFSPRAIDTIIDGTTVRRATLDPLGAGLPAGAGHYFSMMEALARDLTGCLAGGS